MADKVCPNGHVYVGNKCARDNWEEPVEEVKAPEVQAEEILDNVNDEETAVPKAKAKAKAKKAPVKVVKKVAKKGKKSK